MPAGGSDDCRPIDNSPGSVSDRPRGYARTGTRCSKMKVIGCSPARVKHGGMATSAILCGDHRANEVSMAWGVTDSGLCTVQRRGPGLRRTPACQLPLHRACLPLDPAVMAWSTLVPSAAIEAVPAPFPPTVTWSVDQPLPPKVGPTPFAGPWGVAWSTSGSSTALMTGSAAAWYSEEMVTMMVTILVRMEAD